MGIYLMLAGDYLASFRNGVAKEDEAVGIKMRGASLFER
jgi:hypothetical protein